MLSFLNWANSARNTTRKRTQPAVEYTHLLLDIGGVMISYSPKDAPILPTRTITSVLDSPSWHEFERGNLSQSQCYHAACEAFNLKVEVWEACMEQLKSTLTPNQEFIDAVKDIKEKNPNLQIHALSNISNPDFEYLGPIINSWGIFESIITSASLGVRKPDMGTYGLTLKAIKADARKTIFVDDQIENIVNARTQGFKAIHFNSISRVIEKLNNLLGDPIDRGLAFLSQMSKNIVCETNRDIPIKDNFSQLLVLQCIRDFDLVELKSNGPIWQFFVGECTFTDATFPKDSDTTSLAHVVLDTPKEDKVVAMEEILKYLSADGYPLTYHDHKRPRYCHVIIANIFRFFALNGEALKLSSTYEYLCNILETEAYEFGTRYYIQPDWMLYYLSDIFAKRPNDPALSRLKKLLTAQLKRRVGIDQDILGTAMRLIASQTMGVENSKDLETLLEAQNLDGGWEGVWMWNYGRAKVQVGSRAVATAMAVKGIPHALGRKIPI